jgi:hypothetical protein
MKRSDEKFAFVKGGALPHITAANAEGLLSIRANDEIATISPWKTHPWLSSYVVAVRDDCTLRIYSDLHKRMSHSRHPDEAFDLRQAIDLEIIEEDRHPFRFDLKFGNDFTFSASTSTESDLKRWIDALILCCPLLYKKVFHHDIPVYVPQVMTQVDESEDDSQTSGFKSDGDSAGVNEQAKEGLKTMSVVDSTQIADSVKVSVIEALKSELDHQNAANSAALQSIKESLIDFISRTQSENLPILAEMKSSMIKAREDDIVKSAAEQQQQMTSLLRDLVSSFATSSAATSATFMREMQADLTRDQSTSIARLSDEVKKDLNKVVEANKKELTSVTFLLDQSIVTQKHSNDSLQLVSKRQEQSSNELLKLCDDIGLQSGTIRQFSATIKEVQSNILSVGDRSLAAVDSIKMVGKSVENALDNSKTATLTQINTIAQALSAFKDAHKEEARATHTVITDGHQQTKKVLHSLEVSNLGIKEKVADLSKAVETASVHNSASISAVLTHLQSSLRSQESASSALSSAVRDSVRNSHDALASGLSTQISEALRATRDSLMAQLSEALVREQKASDSRTYSTRESLAEHTVKAAELTNRVAGLEASTSQVIALCGRAEAAGAKTSENVLQTRHAVDAVLSTGVSLSSASIDKLVSALFPRVVQSVTSIHEDITKRTNALHSAIESMNAKLGVFEAIMPQMTVITESLAQVDSKLARIDALESRMAEHLSYLERIDQRSQQSFQARAEADIKAKIEETIAEISSSPEKWQGEGGSNVGKKEGLSRPSSTTTSPQSSPYSQTQTITLDSPVNSMSIESIAPAFIAQIRALRLQSAALQGELTRLTGVAGSAKLSEDVRARPEVSAIVSRLEQVESLINETRKAMGGGRIESS